MTTIKLNLTEMAHGGSALGRNKRGQVTFVPYGIPGEVVTISVDKNNKRYARGAIEKIDKVSPHRIPPPCPHFGICGGCHFQHIDYAAQLDFKTTIIRDQLERVGGIRGAKVRDTLPSPAPFHYRSDLELSRTDQGQAGLWSPSRQQVIPIETCHLVQSPLDDLLQDIDLELPGLRRLRLRIGDDQALLAALEMDNIEPPALAADFPVSVAIVLPDRTAANLVGDNFIIQRVRDHDFRVSAGVFFHPNPGSAAHLVDVVQRYAALSGGETVLEGYIGVGMLTAFLYPDAVEVVAVENNPDAVADAALNLADSDNISLYNGLMEAVLLELSIQPQVMVVDPPASGLGKSVITAVGRLKPRRLVYSSSDVATMARDGRNLVRAGYKLVEVQPIDMTPQHYQVHTVSWWRR